MIASYASKTLKSVPREKAFYFFTSLGNYTGMSAVSLKEFMDKVSDVDIKSLEFHLQRGDFQKWVEEVLQDNDLAWEIKRLQRFNLTGNALRNQLGLVVARRYKRLTDSGVPS